MRTFRPLSSDIPSATRRKAQAELIKLRRLSQSALEASIELGTVIGKLRRVPVEQGQPFALSADLAMNEALLRSMFTDCDDIIFRRIQIGAANALLLYVKGMTDIEILEKQGLRHLRCLAGDERLSPAALANELDTPLVASVLRDAREITRAVLEGDSVILLEGYAEGLGLKTADFAHRAVSETVTEDVVRGSHEAFNESIDDNLVLIRRRLRDINLKVRYYEVGERTKTKIAVVYESGLVKAGLVEEVDRRIKRVVIDRLTASHILEENIVEHPWTPFPQMQVTERPDKIVSSICDGRVCIVVNGTPAALLLPVTASALLQSTDDYTGPSLISSIIRMTRFVSAFMAISLPAIYIAIVSYHPGMMPTTLAFSIAEMRARTPFPSFLEALLMEGLLEVFQEAIIRLPKKIAGAAGVVGGLVIGTTVVQAGLVNPLLVVIIAATALASFSMPDYPFAMALRVCRLPMLILGAMLGLYGVMMGVIFLVVHLCSLESFGESYIGGVFEVTEISDWKDKLVRLPEPLQKSRTEEFGARDAQRAGDEIG